MEMEKVSVVIPTYNRSTLIERSINSVLQQTYENLEIIVVDDGSTDDTEAVVNSISDSRIRYIKLPVNSGAANARNVGVDYATGSLIAFQDSDDYWRPQKLEKQMAYWREHPEFQMIYCQYNYFRQNRAPVKVPDDELGGAREGEIFEYLLVQNVIGTPTMLINRECFFACGGFDVTFDSIEDWEFVIRFSKKYLIGYVNEVLVDAYFTMGSVSAARSAFYECRCRIIGTYKEELMAAKIFDPVVEALFLKAKRAGLLDIVKRMLILYLQKKDKEN
ncbi:MAG: glycosyltransferase [Lachnospiraceae bacterium]|nr:glycosyltransferase [Lachnospiraceae bacterium]